MKIVIIRLFCILGLLSGCVLLHNQRLWYSALYFNYESKTCGADNLNKNQHIPDKLKRKIIEKTEIVNFPKNLMSIYDSAIPSKWKGDLEFTQLTLCLSGKVNSFMIIDGGNVKGYLLDGIADDKREEMEIKAKNGILVLKTEEELINKINEVIKDSEKK